MYCILFGLNEVKDTHKAQPGFDTKKRSGGLGVMFILGCEQVKMSLSKPKRKEDEEHRVSRKMCNRKCH